MEKVGVGIAGLGFMARVHSRALVEIPEAKIVAAWSKFPEEHGKFEVRGWTWVQDQEVLYRN
ncbi:MAG: hypothetical protein QXT02_02975 [Candidatus Hadarchaeum sp.]|uniref:hypothetical protein n=1 Tax=Candidatus Hadarchaeum sp. TaxID=2883567 RepID=UPI00317571E3